MSDTVTLRRDGIEATPTVRVGDVVPMMDGAHWTVDKIMEPYCGHTTFGMKRDSVFGARYRIDGVPLITGGVPWIDIAKLAEQQAALARPAAVPAEAIRALAKRWLTDADAAEYATDRLGEKFRERCEAIAGTRRVCASALLRLLGEGDG